MAKRLLLLLMVFCLLPVLAVADGYRDYYEIFVASFYDSDGDGSGDLNGVREKLPMLTELGVTGVWLMPIHPSPSYHKYDVLDYCDIDPAYGTLADFDALAKALNENGIALLLDLVVNHTSSLHPWFVSASKSIAIPDCGRETCINNPLCQSHNPYCDYYHFYTEPGTNRHALDNGFYFEGAFGPHMPDLNLKSEAVIAEIYRIVDFWLLRGVSGFRLDAVMHYEEKNAPFNNAFVKALKDRFPKAYFVGEVWADAATVSRYYESGIDSLFNYPFATQTGALVKAIQQGKGEVLAKKIEAWQKELGSGIDAPFLSNHDNGRSAGFLMRDLKKQKLAAAIYLFMPGNPFIYYGEELGMTGSGKDENKRQPYVWSVKEETGITAPPPGCDQRQSLAMGYMEQRDDPESLFNGYRALLAAKKRHPEIARGQVTALSLGNEALCAYETVYLDKCLTIIHNLSGNSIAFDFDGQTFQADAYGTLLISDLGCEVF